MAAIVKKNSANGVDASVHFNAKAKAAIHNEAQTIIAGGKIAVAKLMPHIAAYRNDKTYADNCEAILTAIVNEVNEYREPRGDKPMAKPRKARASELKACILTADWQCCDAVWEMFADAAMTDGDVLTVARYLQDNVKKTDKRAPDKAKLVAAIAERRANKTGRAKGPDGKPLPAVAKAVDAKKAVDAAQKLVVGWRTWIAAQPALKKQRSAANDAISTFLKAASDLALLAKTATA